MRNRPVVSLPVMLLVTASACGPSAPPSEPVTEPEPSSTAMTETVEDAVRVERLDPALDALVAPATDPILLKGDYFGYLEGPVWTQDGGYLLFSDIPANRIYKWTPDGELSTFLDQSGFTGTDSSRAGMEISNGRLQVVALGSNAITVDPEGRIIFCAHGDRAIKRIEDDGTITVIADQFDGKRLSGPNDLVYRSDGVLYFSDIVAGLRFPAEDREVPTGLYMLKDGTVHLVDSDPIAQAANGMAFSPDEQYLYVGSGPNILRYEPQPDGMLTNRDVLLDMSLEGIAGGADGMKVDREGHIYTVGPGGVWVVTPEGQHIGTITFPAVTNLAFGDADGRTIYFMARRDLYSMRVEIGGDPPGPAAR